MDSRFECGSAGAVTHNYIEHRFPSLLSLFLLKAKLGGQRWSLNAWLTCAWMSSASLVKDHG